MKEILDIINPILKTHRKEDILVVFDIDLTLTIPNEPAVQIPHLKKYHSLLKKILSGLTPAQEFLVFSMATKNPQQILIDKKTPYIIKELQKKGIKVIALSSSITGKLGSINRVEEWRYHALKKLGIKFDSAFSEITDLILTDLFTFRNKHPVFYKGILSTNSPKKIKGTTLVNFLKNTGCFPKMIVMIDDQKENLKEMSLALKKLSPDPRFLGIEYKSGCQFTSAYISEQEFLHYWIYVLSDFKSLYPFSKTECQFAP